MLLWNIGTAASGGDEKIDRDDFPFSARDARADPAVWVDGIDPIDYSQGRTRECCGAWGDHGRPPGVGLYFHPQMR
jgi:hypothetical protein